MKPKKIFSFVLGLLMLVSVLGTLSSIPTIATAPEVEALADPIDYNQDVVIAPIQPITAMPIVTLQPICSVEITDAYGIQGPGDSYAQVVVTGTAVGCNKVEVKINCAGNWITGTAEVVSGFWKIEFDGTTAECICADTPLTVEVACVDPVGVSCRDAWKLETLRCRPVEGECTLYIRDVVGEVDAAGGLRITVVGTATGCTKLQVTITCGARLTVETTVNADGSWKAVFNGILAECKCDAPITINACCLLPVTAQNCCASLTLRSLPCRTPDTNCLVGIERVYGILDPTGSYVERVVIRGFARYCRVVEISMNCQGQEQRTKAAVDNTGRWEAVLPGRLSECVCDELITVKVCCVDPPVKDCCASITLKQLPCIYPEQECAIFIRDVRGEPTAAGDLNVHVTGVAKGCKVVEVVIVCSADTEFRAKATVDANGAWKLVFNALRAKCFCDGPIYVKACCVDPQIDGCCDILRLDALPCPPVEQPCRIQILDVFGLGVVPGTNLIQRVHVRGVALGCEIVLVTIQCFANELRMNVRVDPVSGRWEAIFPGVEAECMCGEPNVDQPAITVKACCVVPDYPNCCDYVRLAKIPCLQPQDCKIHIEGLFAEPESVPVVVAATNVAQGRILKVTVWGVASGCQTVQVTLACRARQTLTATVDKSGHWKVVFNGLLAECVCFGPVFVEACCIGVDGAIKCCDQLTLDQLPCPEIEPVEDCSIEITEVFGRRIELFDENGRPTGVFLAQPAIYVRGLAKGCRVVLVEVTCPDGTIYQVKVEVDPNSGRWLAAVHGCSCDEKIFVRACCIVPDNVKCCDDWEGVLPCEKPEDCKVWIERVTPIRDTDTDVAGRVREVVVSGGAQGCDKVQVFMNCAGNEQMATAEVIDGFWRVTLSGIPAECFCDQTPITVKACCLDDAGNQICCDEMRLERLICPLPITLVPITPIITVIPIVQCDIQITDVFGELITTANGESRVNVHVRGTAKGCREVSVVVECGEKAGVVRALGVVNPSTGRWEGVITGLSPETCPCDQKVIIKVCCLVPEQADCCAYLELDALPCRKAEECRVWIEGVYPEQDPDGRIPRVTVIGIARGCETVQVFMNCAGNEQQALATVEPTGEWKVALDGIVAECFCDRPITVRACCLDAAGNVLCCDGLKLEQLPCPEIEIPPEEECFVEILDVFGEPMLTAAGVKVHVRGIAKGCRVVEVSIFCKGQEVRGKANVDPATGRWNIVLDGLLAECQCDEDITVKACCIIPERADPCCDDWTGVLPCRRPDECRVWIEGIEPVLDADDAIAGRVHRVIIFGGAWGCSKVRVVMNCAGNEQTATVEVIDGFWRVVLDGITAECFCNQRIFIEVCCVEFPNCCDFLELDRLPCPGIPPVTEPTERCHVEILEVIPEKLTDDAGNEVLGRLIVTGKAEGCRKVEVQVTCQETGIKSAEVMPGGEWKVEYTADELAEMGCVCGTPLRIVVFCVDPPRDDCMDQRVIEEPCETVPIEPTTTLPPVTSETREPTETETPGPGFIPGFGMVEVLFAVIALLGLTRFRVRR